VRDHIRFVFRGREERLSAFPPTLSVLDWLREHRRATGTKEGCNEGDCGACTVVLLRHAEGRVTRLPVNACITLVGMLDGAELMTIEDLAEGDALHPVQQAMVDHHGSQCGFCTPGIVMSLFALADGEAAPSRAALNDRLAGNLCRCTGYRPITDAALEALSRGPDRLARDGAAAVLRLAGLAGQEDVFVTAPDGGFFAAPASVGSLAALLAQHPDATLLAGATDVGLWITKRFRPLPGLVWLGRVAGLDRIEDHAERLVIGATATHARALPHLAAIDADLGELGRRFGSPQVRAQGTVGGNIANGSPIGDWAPAFVALGATLRLMHGIDGGVTPATREMPLEEFFLAYGRQDRRPGEFVSALDIPRPRADQLFRCHKVSKRFDEDISAVMGAFLLTLAGRRVTAARVAFGGMAGTPARARATEAALAGVSLDDPSSWRAAVAALSDDFTPLSDMRGSAVYRARTAEALLIRTLREAAGDASTRIIAREAAHAL
jgi:xanthine dehydrogenase small subunit